MAFAAIKTKLGSTECDEYFPKIHIRNDFAKEDNSVSTIMRYIMNDERMNAFTAKEEAPGKCQLQIREQQIEFTEEIPRLTERYYGGNYGPFKNARCGIDVFFIANKNASEIVKQVKEFDKTYEKLGWKQLQDVSLYLDPKGDALVYQNPDQQVTLLFSIKAKRYQIMQLMASCLPRILPWNFEKDPLTDEETNILKMFSEKKYKELSEMFENIYNSFDFYGRKITEAMKGFCSHGFEETISAQQNRIDSLEYDIKEHLDAIRRKEEEAENARIKLMAIRNKMFDSSQDEEEVVEFLKTSKVLTLLDRESNCLRIGVNCFLNDCDEDIFDQYVIKNNKMSSYIFCKSPYSLDITKKLFEAIWKEHRYNVRVYCEWNLMDDCSVQAIRETNMGGRTNLIEDRLPQPHIDRFRCYGSYRDVLSRLQTERDFVGILSTIVASSACINWTDSTVVEAFMDWFFKGYDGKKNIKFLEDADGNRYTVDQVVEILQNENA